MIAEAAIAGVTVCFVACLRFTRYMIDRETKQTEDPVLAMLNKEQDKYLSVIKPGGYTSDRDDAMKGLSAVRQQMVAHVANKNRTP